MPKVGMPDIRKPQLVQATMAVIERVGLHAASIALISREAGVSTGIINHYFGGKHGLLEETMRAILREHSVTVTQALAKLPQHEHQARINAIVNANFEGFQAESQVVKTWLAFWSYSMHDAQLHRLQRVNEQRLLSHLKIELKALLPRHHAQRVAYGIAALIDGIWLRGALNPDGINAQQARLLINDYLEIQLAQHALTTTS
ncbi:transcriptional regulator BetI [Vibrio fluvialis]|nr:transcriptional regulator BetI [Vibrio fluvialis]MBY8194980.1 transcriptional regulator BetI [Vibrio fluvialis]